MRLETFENQQHHSFWHAPAQQCAYDRASAAAGQGNGQENGKSQGNGKVKGGK